MRNSGSAPRYLVAHIQRMPKTLRLIFHQQPQYSQLDVIDTAEVILSPNVSVRISVTSENDQASSNSIDSYGDMCVLIMHDDRTIYRCLQGGQCFLVTNKYHVVISRSIGDAARE